MSSPTSSHGRRRRGCADRYFVVRPVANIINAITWARAHEVTTIVLTGFTGGDARMLADVSIHVQAANYGIVEDLHQLIMHALAQYIRQSRMTGDAISSHVF